MTGKHDISNEPLAGALNRLLRPLVRLLLEKGFTYIQLIQIIRPIYVDLAQREHQTGAKPLSDSQVSLRTGIARRYVKELRRAGIPAAPIPSKITPAAKLIAEWTTNKRYTRSNGEPLPLPRISRDPDAPSFEALAVAASKDIRPRTLLDNLLERKLVTLDHEHQVHLLANAYKPDNRMDELMEFFGVHLHDHISAVGANLSDDDRSFLDRSAFQDKLSEKSIETLKQFSEEQAMKMLRAVYAKAAHLHEKDKKKRGGSHRFRLGVYAFSEEDTH